MAGASGGRTLEQTPTWAVATVCFVLIFISIIIEHIIHLIGHWLMKRHKTALYEALEKLKSELMLLGFLSLLLTVGGEHISHICVSERVGATWLPCKKSDLVDSHEDEESAGYGRRRLMTAMSGGGVRRVLAGAATDKCLEQGKVAFVSSEGIHQLHIFIFVLAVFHVLYCVMTLVIGRLKMRKWKSWEMETRTMEYEFSHDPERFRFARQTSFGRRHLRFWTKNSVLMWIVCFFRQFVRSVPKIDYLTLRHGFVMAHLGPQSQKNFDFQQYINRSLEEDFKVVVGISPPIWFSGLLFMLFNTHGWYAYLWLPFIPLIIILVVGTKLQVIITQMGLSNQEGGEVVKGLPVVKLGDHLFWFSRPRLMLYLINFVLFQNSFQLAFLAWTWYEFGFKSCFANSEDTIIRISMGVLIQILCSYVTLPLYALVTQMGTTMKLTIFNEKVAKALRSWHHAAKKQVRQNNKGSRSASPMSSRPTTPSHHLLRHHRSDGADSLPSSRSRSNLEVENWVSETESPDPSSHHRLSGDGEGSLARSQRDYVGCEKDVDELSFALELSGCLEVAVRQHEMDMGASEFSFQRKSKYTNSKT